MYVDHVRFDPSHPYIERLPTLSYLESYRRERLCENTFERKNHPHIKHKVLGSLPAISAASVHECKNHPRIKHRVLGSYE